MTTSLLLLALSLVLVGLCGLFVAAEFSFVTVDRNRVDQAAAEGDAGAQGVQTALRSLSTQLSGAQVGITLTNLGIGFLAEPAIADLVAWPPGVHRHALRRASVRSRSRSDWWWARC